MEELCRFTSGQPVVLVDLERKGRLAEFVEKVIPRMSSALVKESGRIQCMIYEVFLRRNCQPTFQMKEEVDGEQILMFS